jgi:RHS repeat-associated protein
MLDAAGRLRSIINPLGQKTVYTRDALDRITLLTDAINGVTQFGYDANSNLLTVTDAKSQQTVYTPNNMNRTVTRRDPLLRTETYTYDNNGNLSTVLDRKSQTTTYTYDPLNRRTKATFQDGTSTNYTYDAGNRITQVQEKNASNVVTATITRTYDGLDRLTQEVTAQGTVNYTYDNASRRATMTVVGQPQVVYTYDNANRLTNIQQGTSNIVIGYDDADRRTSVTYPNTNKVEYGYNVASELTTVTYKQGTTTLATLTYTYDLAGNRIKTGGTFARSNIPPALTTTNYNANNQQLTFGTTTETYDFNGNLATTTDAGVTTTYTWNARNQLTGISKTGFTASFTYDSFGRRTGRTVNGAVINYVYDGLNPVQEKNGATVTANLLTGLGIDEFFTRTDGVGVRSLLPDALGSTVALGDGTGTLQTQYTYEPFGFVSQTGAASTSSYKYTGREDDGSWLLYYRARYYHPRLQRFISEDPMEFSGNDINLYGYVGNSPVRFFDPLGWIRWNKNPPDTVPVTGQTLTNLQCVEGCLRQQTNNPILDLLMTGGAESKGHTRGSHHPKGEACDIAGPAFNPVTSNQVLDCASRCGFGAGQFEDYPGVNRDHWHIQIYPGNGVPALPPPPSSPPMQPGQTP